MKVKKLLILTLILSLIMSSMSACVKEDSVSESKNKKESISDEKKTTEKDDKEESEESKTSDEESESKGGETDSDASSDNVAVDSSDTVASGDGNTETTTTKKPTVTGETTKKPTTTTAETTKKPTSTSTAETTTKKPASTTTAQTTTKNQSSTSTPDYGPIINQCSYDINDYSRRGVSDKAKAQAVTVLNSILKTSMTEVERVRAIHDWMVININYNYSAAADINNAPASALSAEGALVNKNVVCEGYSEAFMTLCWTAGIDARLVTGDANDGSGSIGHEWNVVKVDGKWYQIDVTWDDPAVNGVQNDSTGSNLRYEYFLITTADMTKDHIIEEYFNAGNISCTSKDFYTTVDTWAIKNIIGDVPYTKITSYSEGNTAAQNYFNKGITKFALIYTEGKLDYNTIRRNVMAELVVYIKKQPEASGGCNYGTGVVSKNDRGYTIDLLTSTITYN